MLAQQNILLKNADLTNITLTNANIQSFETMNKTMEYNIKLLNKRVDVLIIKLIKLFIMLVHILVINIPIANSLVVLLVLHLVILKKLMAFLIHSLVGVAKILHFIIVSLFMIYPFIVRLKVNFFFSIILKLLKQNQQMISLII